MATFHILHFNYTIYKNKNMIKPIIFTNIKVSVKIDIHILM